MPVDPRPTRADGQRVLRRLRALVATGEPRWKPLALLVDSFPKTDDGADDWDAVALPTDADTLAPASNRLTPPDLVTFVPKRDTRARRERRRRAADAAAEGMREQTGALAERYHSGDLSADAFRDAFRLLVKDAHLGAAVAGNEGGWDAMTKRDWGRVGRAIRDQYAYADRMISEVEAARADDNLPTVGQLRARMDLYADAASQSRSRQEVAARGFDPAALPAHPGDGSTECWTRCKCSWVITTVSVARDEYRASWRLGDSSDVCSTCRKRSTAWKSLRVSGGVVKEGGDEDGTRREGSD